MTRSSLPRASDLLPYLLLAVLPLMFFAPYLSGRAVPFGDDILLLNYPLFALLGHAVRAGYPILWNPYSGGGYPLAPFGALLLYPPTWLLAVLSVLAAMSWTYALDLIAGALGSYALAARLGITRAGRLVSAVAFPFGGFVLAHLYAGHFLEVGLICWFPCALAALHWMLDAPTIRTALRRGLAGGAPIGMLILANGTSWLVFAGYPLALVALVLVWQAVRHGYTPDRRAPDRAIARCVIALAAAGLVAGLLGAGVLLPLCDILGNTVRSGAMSYHAATRISEPPLGLAMLAAPGLFGSDTAHTYWFPNPDAYFQEVYAYTGVPVLVLALIGIVCAWRRPHVPLYAALAVLGLILALGAYTPVYGVLYHAVPGLDLARVPARWLLPFVLSVAVLAGAGADALLGRRGRAGGPAAGGLAAWGARSWERAATPLQALIALGLVLALGLIGIAVAAHLPSAAHHGATIGDALARLLVASVATALVILLLRQLPRPAAAALLFLLVIADLWTANGILVQPLDPAPYYRGPAVDLAQAHAGGGRVWALDRAIPLRLGMLDRRTRDIQDFAPLTLLDYWRFVHPGRSLAGVDTGMARADDLRRYNARLADLLGVSLVLAPHPLSDPDLRPVARVWAPHWGLLNGDWSHPGPHPAPAYAYAVTRHLPFAAPLYTVRILPGRVPLDRVFAPDFDPHGEALLDGGSAPAPAGNPLLDAWRSLLAPRLPSNVTAQANGTDATVALGGAGQRLRVARPAGATGRRIPAPSGSAGAILLAQSENGSVVRVTMRQAGVVLFDQVYDPGWTALVDGHPAVLRRADYLLTAVPLTAGTHTVTLVYAPSSVLAGALLTLSGYVLVLIALCATVRRHTRPQVANT